MLRPLGAGSVGDIRLCVDPGERRLVVVKRLRADLDADGGHAERLRREAQKMTGYRVPGIVGVESWAQDGEGRASILMDFVDGVNPAVVIKPGDCWSVHRLMHDVGRTLDDLHERGVLHRDIKPDNLILRQDDEGWSAIIIDFGVAKWLEMESATQTGSMLGTPFYMSPEQFRDSKHVGTAADRYALAVVAYELLSGLLPFVGASLGELLRGHRDSPVPPLQFRGPEGGEARQVPKIDSFMARALAKDPEERFETGVAMAAAFQEAAEADGVWTPPPELPRLFPKLVCPVVDVTLPDGCATRQDLREGPVVIGRQLGCQVQINSKRISRYHTCLYRQRGRLWVADLESLNGTIMDGQLLESGVPAMVDQVDRTFTLRLDAHELSVRTLGE